jgi:hypothetical protein
MRFAAQRKKSAMPADYKTLLGLVREIAERPLELDPVGGDWLTRARAAIEPSQPKNDVKILHMTASDDPCCSKHFHRAARIGTLDTLEKWECPSCFCEWKMSVVDGVHFWQPSIALEVFPLP